MKAFSSKWFLLVLVALPCLVAMTSPTGNFVMGAEDEVEEEDDAAAVEDEDEGLNNMGDADDGAFGTTKKNVHRDADTFLLFTNPATYPDEAIVGLPAGKIAEFLVGFRNKGEDGEFVLGSVDASLRYPMDYTIHLQNFSAVRYQKPVKAGQEATVSYSFIPADAFAGRPIGLTINLNYEGPDGSVYVDPVFNRTVQITEYAGEGLFDTEVVFMYIFLTLGAFCLLFLVYTLAVPKSKSKKPAQRKPVETGTTNDDVDYEWIPRSALQTPGGTKSSGTSPRQRKSNSNRRGNPGSDTE